MQVLKIRVVPDVEADVFRDIQIGVDRSMKELYDSIIKTFGFRGDQMASFYLSNDEWDKGHEIALMDMGGTVGDLPNDMASAISGEIITHQEQKVILVYDFLKMWCFYLEVLDITEEDNDGTPEIIMSFGEAPIEDDKELPDLMDGILAPVDPDKNAYDFMDE